MSDLIYRVQEWLTKTGYPLEMQASQDLREVGFEVRQATMFIDALSQKWRDIDIHAFLPNFYGDVALSLVVECKKSDKPWVVLTSTNTLSGFNRLFLSGLSTYAVRGEIVDAGSNHSFFRHLHVPDRCGYVLKQAMSGESDPAYSACTGVMSAARSILQKGTRSLPEPYHIAVPVIVVDTPLFEAELNDSQELEIKKVEHSKLLFGWDHKEFGPTCIQVVSIEFLSEFGKKYAEIAREVIDLVERKPFPERARTQMP